MKREAKSSIPFPGNGTMMTTDRRMTSNYQEATMKLRERVLSQNRRTYRNKSFRGAPPFQNRNLDNYPMTYGREDAVRSASGHRQEKRLKQANISKTKLDSETLKDYSKQMFDVAVKTVGQNGINVNDNHRNNSRMASESIQISTRSTASSRLSMRCNTSTSFSDCRRNNGPSREGSIIYNTRQQLLNSIRIRSHSEPVILFNHEKNKSKAALKEAINEKNLNYTVRPSRSSLYSRAGSVAGSTFGGSTCSSSDFVLVPLNDNYIDKKYSSDLCFSDLNDSLETDKDTFDEDSDLNSVFRSPSQTKSRMLPPSATYGIRLFSLEEDSASESEEEMAHTPADSKKVDASPQHKPLDKNPNIQEPIEDPETRGQKLPEAEPEKPVHVKIHLKGPHCWVDDATVTSELSDQEPDEYGEKDQANPDDTPKPEVDKAPLVKRISQLELEQKVDKTPALTNDTDQCLKNSPEPEIMSLSEVTEDHLPSFLCPSSEKKSREAAIKDWLAHTCFRTGHRGFPLV